MIVRKLLIGVAAVLGLVVAAGVFIPLAVPVGVYRARVEALVKEAIGRELTIAGPIKLSVLPALAVEASDVYFANMPGARSPDMAAVKQLRIELKFRPLLHRLIVVRRLDLVRPVIALEVDKTGRPNWVFGPAANSAAPPGGMPASGKIRGGLDISGLSLPKVRLSDGKISYFDQRTGKTEGLDGIDATLSLHSLGKAFAGDGSAVWNGEQVTFAVNIANPLGLFDGAESEVGVKLAAAPATLDFSGRVAGSPSLRLDGSLGVESKSLRRFARWAGSPIALDGEGLGPLTVKGTVAIAGTVTSLTDAAISLDAIKAKGSVSIDSAGLRPALAGKLDIDRLDLNPYLAAAAAATVLPPAAGSASPAPATSGRDGMPIDLSALKLADADFDLTLGSIAFGQIQIGASAGKIRVKDG
ncbi:MAG TPA: AsmA family protein, partial [Stellaceae bacterium]|nr:AsmA family protein [Stellaceae bacterium]